ncbi:MAG: FAD-binding and (Fe-S)-binding domain-containing protein [Yaniella sp.]|uniref:FAD-binding and (Fe-S)-binding domain-containing protein n=1 Tax=Yaniella sp. TaxID=2773929 RepID=UPI003F9E117F
MTDLAPTIVDRVQHITSRLDEVLDGDVDATSLTRSIYSTDASNYRVVPDIVVLPRHAGDVVAAVDIARDYSLSVTPRGGGTSCAGNAVGPGLVLDFSRYMNQVLHIDAEAQTAVVQPGVVLADLQKALAPHGLRFGPDPSTANRATIGGMIGNNACGPHGLSYGRTADNVVAMRWLTGSGDVLDVGEGADALTGVDGLEAFVMNNLAVLRTDFGRFGRQISGYSLEHLLPENNRNLAATLAGTEGTAGMILEATVKVVPTSAAPALAVLGYPDMATAADDVVHLLPHKPLALEGLDAQLVDVIRRAKGKSTTPSLPEGGGWLMVEVDGTDTDDAMRRADALIADASATDSVVHAAGPEAIRLWQIRADGAGLAGRTADGLQAWPGWEDSAVPPEHLGDYLRDLQALMEQHKLSGLAYGHFGDGCIHLRIDFPLATTPDVMRAFMEKAAALAASYGGSLSGEHGDGRARSELLPTMYSPEALAAMAQFKGLFDPDDLLNPGVVVRPDPLDANLRRPAAAPMMASDGFAFAQDGGDISSAIHRCVGVGKCRADARDTGQFMCPSFTATRDEKDSTRGRARALQEMLNGGVVSDGWASPELHDALDLCLSCKACANDCPTGIDMATFKSETLHRTYQGKLRPRAHYTLGRLPQWLRLAGPFARLVNVLGKITPLRKMGLFAMGADGRRSLPKLATKPFRRLRKNVIPTHRPTGPKVVLWVDSFTDSLSPEIALDAITVLEAAGCDVKIADPGICCGLTLISTGQLTAAKRKLTNTVKVLHPYVAAGYTVVGLEPSCTATLRSDLVELLPRDAAAKAVSDQVKTIAELLTSLDWQPPQLDRKLLVQPHCHQYAIMGFDTDEKLLEKLGCDVEISSGCCGLAGNFGMEQGHYDVSVKIAADGILQKIDASPDREVLADGFSCRTQITDLDGTSSRHIVQLIAEQLKE